MSSLNAPLTAQSARRSMISQKMSSAATYVLFIILSFIAIYPLVWIFTNSVKTDVQLYDNSWGLPG